VAGFRWSTRRSRIVGATAALYAVLGTVYFSHNHGKTEEIRKTYAQLHPVLRLAVGTLLLADNDVVLTSTIRTRQDYSRMGLPVYAKSKHFAQADGSAHATDVRTIGRSEWANWWTAKYFRTMGFETIRHGGTADHLHVALR